MIAQLADALQGKLATVGLARALAAKQTAGIFFPMTGTAG